jgi:ribulose-phosphate 3-epimerase
MPPESMPPVIAPSLLAANYSRLATEVTRIKRSGAPWVHVDIMDGHFVPNLSFGPALVRSIRPLTDLFLDVHLMCARPDILLEPFADAGADLITVHAELGERVSGLLWRIRALGRKVGLAINPPTAMAQVEPYLDQIDLLLVMTVNPGFGGQPFITETLTKIQQARAWRSERRRNFRIEVDGGITFDTAAQCAEAGADTFVSGTGLFRHPNLGAAVRKMLRRIGTPRPTPAEGRGPTTQPDLLAAG